MGTYFTETFGVDPDKFDEYGAFDISLVTDLPLFIDPFLLFGSDKEEHNKLHDQIIDYLIFLRNKSMSGPMLAIRLESWYCFPEIKQTWLGFSVSDNGGRGLGRNFAGALNTSLTN
jgi:hypothetical protein